LARRLPSLNALKAFEAAARHESFTDAAEELFAIWKNGWARNSSSALAGA
jgi:hypothetical protein